MRKHRKFIKVVVITTLLATFLTGCVKQLDIEDKLIVTTVAFDLKDEQVWYYLEIANIEKSKGKYAGADAGEKYIVIQGHGESSIRANEYLDMQIDKPLYLSGVRTIVLTERFAKKHLVEYLYRFRAIKDYRKKGLIVITKQDLEELYKSAHENSNSVGFWVDGIIHTLEQSGKSFKRTTMRLLESISSKYSGILIPCMALRDGEILLEGYSVINGVTVTGFLPRKESVGTLFLKADKPKAHFIVPYNGMNLTLEVFLKKRKITPSYKDGIISYDIKMEYRAELMYGDKKTPYNFGEAAIREVTETLKAMLKQEVSDAIEKAQKEFECDYLQFDDIFRIKFPVEFQDMDWQKEFLRASTNIEVKVDLGTKWSMDYGTNKVK